MRLGRSRAMENTSRARLGPTTSAAAARSNEWSFDSSGSGSTFGAGSVPGDGKDMLRDAAARRLPARRREDARRAVARAEARRFFVVVPGASRKTGRRFFSPENIPCLPMSTQRHRDRRPAHRAVTMSSLATPLASAAARPRVAPPFARLPPKRTRGGARRRFRFARVAVRGRAPPGRVRARRPERPRVLGGRHRADDPDRGGGPVSPVARRARDRGCPGARALVGEHRGFPRMARRKARGGRLDAERKKKCERVDDGRRVSPRDSERTRTRTRKKRNKHRHAREPEDHDQSRARGGGGARARAPRAGRRARADAEMRAESLAADGDAPASSDPPRFVARIEVCTNNACAKRGEGGVERASPSGGGERNASSG